MRNPIGSSKRWRCSVLVLLLLQSSSSRAESVSSLVPSNAVAYVATSNIAELDQQWRETGFAHLWQADAMEEFTDSFHQSNQISPDCQVPRLGLSWSQMREVGSGEVCWALVPVGDEAVGFLLLLDVSENDAQVTALLAQLRTQYAQDKTITLHSPVLAGHQVDRFQIRDAPPDESTPRIYFHHADLFGVTNQEELADHVLSQLVQGKRNGLPTTDAFKIVDDHLRTAVGRQPAQLTWFLDPWEFARVSQPASGWKLWASWLRLKREGFDMIRAAGGRLVFSTPQHDLEHHWFVYAPGAKQKAARMLHFSPLADAKLPDWIPADADSVLCAGWNLADALVGYGSWFDASWAEGELGTFDEVLQDIKTEPYGPQVDIRHLLNLQDGPVLAVTESVERQPSQRSSIVYAVKLRESAWAQAAVRRMLESDDDVDRVSVGEEEMWVFFDEAASADMTPTGPGFSGYAVSVAHGSLFVSTSEALLARVLQTRAATFRPMLEEINTIRPKSCCGWRFAPSSAGLGPTFERLRTGGRSLIGDLLANRLRAAEQGGDQPKDVHQDSGPRRIDFSKLPPPAILERFLPRGFGFVEELDRGWRFSDYVAKFSDE